jgi:fido (protein-threonine AMPylation protein)
VLLIAKELDFIERLAEFIASYNFPYPLRVGNLLATESMAIMLLPGGDETVYFDGVRDKQMNIAIDVKATSTLKAYQTLNVLFQLLENLNDLPSKNDSYDFNDITTTNAPSQIGKDETFELWECTFAFDLTIYD